MKGKILSYDAAQKKGLISGSDGERYAFDATQWKLAQEPAHGMAVDFTAEGGAATEVYADPHAIVPGAGSKRLVAALLAFFLGSLGIHKFYLGYTKQGVIMLMVFLLGWILLGLPSLVISLIAFIETILYLIKSDEVFEQTYVIGHKGWF